MSLLLRTRVDAASFLPAVTRLVHAIDPSQPVAASTTIRRLVSEELARHRLRPHRSGPRRPHQDAQSENRCFHTGSPSFSPWLDRYGDALAGSSIVATGVPVSGLVTG
jgi:hypothetical protein